MPRIKPSFATLPTTPLVILLTTLLACSTQAQPDTASDTPPRKPSRVPGLLSGPSVEIDALPGLERTFGGDTAMVERMGARAVPMRDYLQILQKLQASTDAELTPEPEQQTEIRAVLSKFRKEITEARASQRRQQAEDAPVSMAPQPPEPDAETPSTPPTPAKQRQQRGASPAMQALVVDTQQAVWVLLTEAQRAFVSEELVRLDEEMQAERVERELAKLGDSPASPSRAAPARADPLANAFNPDGSVNLDALPDRLRERIAGLSESRQRQAIERLRERLNSRDQAAQGARSTGRSLPPPPISSVDVPDPD